jgi:hypothetical protein
MVFLTCSSYAPLSVRLIESELFESGGWNSATKTHQIFSKFFNPLISMINPVPLLNNNNNNKSLDTSHISKSNVRTPLVFVLMLGGLTYGEIAAFRWIAIKKNINLILLTSKILNYNILFNQCREFA